MTQRSKSLEHILSTAEAEEKRILDAYRSFLMSRYSICAKIFLHVFKMDAFAAFSQDYGYRYGPYLQVDFDTDTVDFYKDTTHHSPIEGAGGPVGSLEKAGDLAMIVDMMERKIATLYGKQLKEAEAAVKALKNVRV